jgi:hypothetical protein
MDLKVATVARDVARLYATLRDFSQSYPGPEHIIAMVARNVERLYATFRDFPRRCVARLRDFIKLIANDRKTSIHMTYFFFVIRPSATFRNFARLVSATLAARYTKVRFRIGLTIFRLEPLFCQPGSILRDSCMNYTYIRMQV